MRPLHNWEISDAPSQSGRLAVVTGASGGLGLEVAAGLAQCGAHVILAARNASRADAALKQLHARVPNGRFSFHPLDLASLASVATFAQTLSAEFCALDVLVNNAGVMAPPQRMETLDGFELQFGTNHLGHFALTGRLLPLLRGAAQGGVVVSVASLAAWRGSMPFDDLNARHRYNGFVRYQQSKLANLLFAMELDRRSRQHGWGIRARAAHPGWALSDILDNGPMLGKGGILSRGFNTVAHRVFSLMGQDTAHGALPLLYAAVAPQACDGCYYGPQGRGERTGPPGLAGVPPAIEEPGLAARLWDVSERMTGLRFANAILTGS